MIRANVPDPSGDASSSSSSSSQRATVLRFIDQINAHDVEGIVAMLSDDYQFVNSSGDRFTGRGFMRETWLDQFGKHPDYRIRVQRVIADENGVAVFGFSEGTYAPDGSERREENKWSVPAAHLFTASGDRITYYETFSDASMVYDLMQARASGEA